MDTWNAHYFIQNIIAPILVLYFSVDDLSTVTNDNDNNVVMCLNFKTK